MVGFKSETSIAEAKRANNLFFYLVKVDSDTFGHHYLGVVSTFDLVTVDSPT
jgi:hypothetical protein